MAESSLIIKDLDLYPQPPTNSRSLILDSEEPRNRTNVHPWARASSWAMGMTRVLASCDIVIEQWSGVAHRRVGTNGACRRDAAPDLSHRNPHRI